MSISFFLSPPIIASIVIAAVMGLTIRALINYNKQTAEIRLKLKRLDRELAKWHDGTAEKRKIVAELESRVTPFREKEAPLRAYYDSLEALSLSGEKEFLAQQAAAGKSEIKVRVAGQQEEERPKRKLEINLKKKGFR